jgi:hypothetical protein
MPGRGLPKSQPTNRHEVPQTAIKHKGPVHNAGTVGLHNFNDSPVPLPREQRRKAYPQERYPPRQAEPESAAR